MALISADPVGVTDARPGVAGVGDTVQDILTRLAVSLDAEGACWGDDEAGDVFAGHYLPAEESVRQVLAEIAAGLHDVGALLDTVSGTFGSAENRARTAWEA